MDALRTALTILAVALGFVAWWRRATWPRAAVAGTAALAVVIAATASYLWLAPRFELTLAQPDKPILAGETRSVVVTVRNTGLLSGTFTATYSVDGELQANYSLDLSGRLSRDIELPLPYSLSRGDHALAVGDHVFSVHAFWPPTLVALNLRLSPKFARPGQRIRVSALVENAGDLRGELLARLRVGRFTEDTRTLTLDPGEQRTVTMTFRKYYPGRFRVRLADRSTTVFIVRPVRFANGTVVFRHIWGGVGKITIKNDRGPKDGMFVLTRPHSRETLLAVYVRAHQNATVTGIPNGTYWAYYWTGSWWNWTTHGFLVTRERGRYKGNLTFSTRSWTTSWSDYYYRYTQRYTQYSHWVLSLYSVGPGSGNAVATVPVSAAAFPRVR